MSNFKHKYFIAYMQELTTGMKFGNDIINTNANTQEVIEDFMNDNKVVLNVVKLR